MMPGPRSTLLWLPAVAAVFALIFISAHAATQDVAGYFHVLALTSLTVSTAGVLSRGLQGGSGRIGYAVFGWTYYAALYVRDAAHFSGIVDGEFAAELSRILGFFPVYEVSLMDECMAVHRIVRWTLLIAYSSCGAALEILLARRLVREGIPMPVRNLFHLRLLVFAVALIVAVAGVWINTGRVAGYFDEVAVGSLAVATLGAILWGPRRGANWAGYSVFGWTYYIALFIRDRTYQAMFPDLEVSAMLEQFGVRPEYGESAQEIPGYVAIHCSLLIAFACLGMIAGRRLSQQPSRDSTPCSQSTLDPNP